MTPRLWFLWCAGSLLSATAASARDLPWKKSGSTDATGDVHWHTHLLAHYQCGSGHRFFTGVSGYSAPDGTELAILLASGGASFVDVTRPSEIHEVAFIPFRVGRGGIAVYSTYAYIADQGGGGMQIVDLSDPHHPTRVGAFDSTFTTAENMGVYDGYAYIDDSFLNGVWSGLRILDLSNPTRPRDVGGYLDHGSHDSYVRDDIAYLGSLNGFTILDVHDKSHPREISFTSYPSTHSIWTTADGHYAFATNEGGTRDLRIWDVSDLEHPSLVGSWSASPTATIHYAKVKGDSLYIAYYSAGMHVLDISNPTSPVHAASYDFYPNADDFPFGNYDVHPFARSGAIYLSGWDEALYVVALGDGPDPELDFQVLAPASQAAPPGAAQVEFDFEVQNAAPERRDFRLSAGTSDYWPTSVQRDLSLAAGASQVVPVLVPIPPFLFPVRQHVILTARSCLTGLKRSATTQLAVPVVLQRYDAECGDGSVLLRWKLGLDPEEQITVVLLRADRDAGFVERMRSTLREGTYRDVEVAPGREYIYQLAVIEDSVVRVLGECSVEIPRLRSAVLGSQPSPFSHRTHIRYRLAQPGEVQLRIYDLRGRVVRELMAKHAGSGVHEIAWDGADTSGHALASGVYFYEIRNRGWVGRGRVTLVR